MSSTEISLEFKMFASCEWKTRSSQKLQQFHDLIVVSALLLTKIFPQRPTTTHFKNTLQLQYETRVGVFHQFLAQVAKHLKPVFLNGNQSGLFKKVISMLVKPRKTY